MSLLLEAADAHFAWLLGEAPAPDDLRLPPGGLDKPWVFDWLRGTLRRLDGQGVWLMVEDGEVVGSCCFKGPPEPDGTVSLGWGVAPERQGRGHETLAVAEVIAVACRRPDIRRLVVVTAAPAADSRMALEANGFAETGRVADPKEGELVLWRLELGTQLADATDAHFAWMLGEIAAAPDGLRLQPGGLDEPWVLEWLRGVRRRIGGPGSWLMVADGEVVGLCGYKNPPDAKGGVEIGYGVAPERLRRGHATRAVAELVAAARLDQRVVRLFAQTALSNQPSQRVLEANGFEAVGRGDDEDEGETIVWRLKVGG